MQICIAEAYKLNSNKQVASSYIKIFKQNNNKLHSYSLN